MSSGNRKTTRDKGYPPSGTKSKKETIDAAANKGRSGKTESREPLSNKDGAKKSPENKVKKGATSMKSSTKSKGKGDDDSSMQSNQTDTESGKNGTDSSSHTKETGPTDTGSNQDTDETGPTDTGSNQPTDETRETDRTTDESKKSTEPDPSKSDSSLTTDSSSKDKAPENDLKAAVEYVEGFIKDKVFGHEATKLVESIEKLHKNRVDMTNYKDNGEKVVEETKEIFKVTKEVLAEDLFSHVASFKRILEEDHKLINDTEGNPIRFEKKDSTEDKEKKNNKKEENNEAGKVDNTKKSERKYSRKKKRKNLMEKEEDNPEEKKNMSNIALEDLKQEGRKLVYFDNDIILFTNNIKKAKDVSGEFIQLIAFPNDLKLKSIRSLENTKSHEKFLRELENLRGKILKMINKERSDPKLKDEDLFAKFDYYPERYWLNCKFSLESEEIIYGQHVRDLADVLNDLGKTEEDEKKDEKKGEKKDKKKDKKEDKKMLFEGNQKADLVIKKRIHLAARYIHSLAEENKELTEMKNELINFSERVWKKFEVMRDSLGTEGKEPDHIRNCKYLFLTSMTIYALTKNFKFKDMDFVMHEKLEMVHKFIEKKYSESVKAEETGEPADSSESSRSEITYI